MRRTPRSATGRRCRFWLGSAVFVLALSHAYAAPPPLRVPYRTELLRNGLRIVLSEDRSSSVISINVTYGAGSGDEEPGLTGLAHLLEHMMFEGSSKVGRGEHGFLVRNMGGTFNAGTGSDRTVFYETLPSSALELALFLESDRMRSLVWSAASFETQRKVVQEELRLRVRNQTYGASRQELMNVAYERFPYRHAPTGEMADLDHILIEDVRTFWTSYYAPNNALLVLAGDFDKERVLAAINRWFGDIAPRKVAQRAERRDPPQTAERRIRIEDPFARSTRLDIGYKLPQGNTSEWYAALVSGYILGSGAASRLHQALSDEAGLVESVAWSTQHRLGTPLGTLSLVLMNRSSPSTVVSRIDDSIDQLSREPVESWELERVYRQIRRDHAFQLRSLLSRADLLSQYEGFYGDVRALNDFERNIRAVRQRDIQRVAAKWFRKQNRTLIETIPEKAVGKQATHEE